CPANRSGLGTGLLQLESIKAGLLSAPAPHTVERKPKRFIGVFVSQPAPQVLLRPMVSLNAECAARVLPSGNRSIAAAV
ncbi:MAG TPA: hypothetical protein VEV37_05140, partial [Bryobacteraceae bacterium]|nr:hypothetical protein [Bryobacteraceae bacterium]